MRLKMGKTIRATLLISMTVTLIALSTRLQADTGTCGGQAITLPFTDVPSTNIFFCSIAEAYFSALTNGTSATTYSPSANVPRDQMAAFVTRTQDSALRRGSRRAALKQWWTPSGIPPSAASFASSFPRLVECDGADLWVAGDNGAIRVDASSGREKQIWTGATNAYGVVVARGLIYVTGATNPGQLWRLDPRAEAINPVATLEANNLGAFPQGIAFDGGSIWTANLSGSVSIRAFLPGGGGLTLTFSDGFVAPIGLLYDGAAMWVTDQGDDSLKKLGVNASIVLSVPVGADPVHPVFDGTNIWVPNSSSNSLTVVRVKDVQGNSLAVPFVLATLTGNGLSGPRTAAFDGQRILVTNLGNDSVSLWKAADLTPLGSVSTGAGTSPLGACSDGVNFWITLSTDSRLGRF